MKKVELLSPVGNMDMFYQAIHNGADAVYLAGTNYGARKFARNFTENELIEVIEYAHLYGVKVYITVNTLIYDYEIADVLRYIEFLHFNGVDAVIMQDMGVISIVREMFPNLEIHASTQCHNHNQEIISLWKKLGITRVVFAREMSLDEIKDVNVDIEKEVFVYGALCVCYSGCCLFSSLNGGRSGNRGECVGSCRLPYKLICNDKEVSTNGDYILSTKELNTLEHIKELLDAGIDSFKIEGRMKSPSYVGYVTRLYRILIDKYYNNEELKLTKEEVDNLKKLFNRDFTKGYLFNDKDIMNIKSPNHLGVEIGEVLGIEKNKIKIKLINDNINQNDGIRFKNMNDGMMINKLYNKNGLLVNTVLKGNVCYLDKRFDVKVGDVVLKTIDSELIKNLEKFTNKKIMINMKICCQIGKKMELKLFDDSNEVIVYGNIVEKALKSEVSEIDIKRQLSKLGSTPFELNNLNIIKDDNIFVSLKELNEIRRNAVLELIGLRKKKKFSVVKQNYQEDNSLLDNDNKNYLHVLVRNEEQLLTCLDNEVDNIYVTNYDLYLKYKHYSNIFYRVDRVNSKYLDLVNERLLIGEMGSVEKYSLNNTLIGDYYLNVTNRYSVQFLRKFGLRRITLSVELDENKVKDIMIKKYPVELVIYGRVELMVMKYCPLNKNLNYCSNCKNNCDKFYLEDKFGNKYPMIRNNCLTHILHYQAMNKISDISKYQEMGIHHYRLELFDEDENQLKDLINSVRNYY